MDLGAATQKTMPALATGTHAHMHSVHSALESLETLGVPAHRVRLRRIGRSAERPGTVVAQQPAPGTPLSGDTLVELQIAGLGFTHALPVGMWDSGGEATAGTREILENFDDPLEKLAHWFYEGAPLFRISPGDLPACARWLRLFGIDAEEWPRALWFPLATLAARIPQLSCSENGCAFVLDYLLGLHVQSFSYNPRLTVLPESALSTLGSRASRLGIDCVLGDAIEDLAVLQMEIGPVALPVYQRYAESTEGAALLRRTLAMFLPLSTHVEVRWSVQDRSRAPQLGVAAGNARLGINTHMGDNLAATGSLSGAETHRSNA